MLLHNSGEFWNFGFLGAMPHACHGKLAEKEGRAHLFLLPPTTALAPTCLPCLPLACCPPQGRRERRGLPPRRSVRFGVVGSLRGFPPQERKGRKEESFLLCCGEREEGLTPNSKLCLCDDDFLWPCICLLLPSQKHVCCCVSGRKKK